MNERELFLAAVELSDPGARALYLDNACAGDAALRARIEALLKSHEEAGNFLKKPAVGTAVAHAELGDPMAGTAHDMSPTSPGSSVPSTEVTLSATRDQLGPAAGRALPRAAATSARVQTRRSTLHLNPRSRPMPTKLATTEPAAPESAISAIMRSRRSWAVGAWASSTRPARLASTDLSPSR